jgi:hypothetical protein
MEKSLMGVLKKEKTNKGVYDLYIGGCFCIFVSFELVVTWLDTIRS